jgi:hypothetical protein
MLHKLCICYTTYVYATQIMYMLHNLCICYTTYVYATQIMYMLHKLHINHFSVRPANQPTITSVTFCHQKFGAYALEL